MNNLIKYIKTNTKFSIMLIAIIIMGSFGVTFAYLVVFENFDNIAIDSTVAEVDATITYDDASNGAEIVNEGNMLPIDDAKVSIDTEDPRVIKAKFYVTGVGTNPENSIYDIALRNVDIPCPLKTTDFKWRLYKNSELLNEGNFSPTFDNMSYLIGEERMLLTDTQEDLTEETNEYILLLWISESCTGNISDDECKNAKDQSAYLNQEFSATIKLELATKAKKENVRQTSSEGSCDYAIVEIPICNDITYNGTAQTLIDSGVGYSLYNTTGTNAGIYSVTAILDDEHKWTNGSTEEKVINCSLAKKDVTITTLDQDLILTEELSSELTDVTVDGLLEGDQLEWVTLTTSTVQVGKNSIIINNVKIVNSSGKDVTENYNIIKNNIGVANIENYMVTATIHYYNGAMQEIITTDCDIRGTDICSFEIPNVVLDSVGPSGATYYGLSTSPSSSTITTVYNSSNINYYAVYEGTFTATYLKDDLVTSIGSTSNSCVSYGLTDGTTYTIGCEVTLPQITVDPGYASLGWYNYFDTKVGEPGGALKLTENTTLTAIGKRLEASDFTYDNSNTKVKCSDVQCMIDKLDEILEYNTSS